MIVITKPIKIYAIINEEKYKTKDLSFLDKLVFERITALCHTNKKRYATNSYFANMYGVKSNTVTVAIRKLKKLKLIKVSYEKENPNKSKRYIMLINEVWCEQIGMGYLLKWVMSYLFE